MAAATSGCVIISSPEEGDGYVYPAGAVHQTIDAGAVMSTELGEGVGLFVEYASGGRWTVWTSCDTALAHESCYFDVYVTASSVIGKPVGVDLEEGDHIDRHDQAAISLHVDTDWDSDEMRFDTAPGAVVELELVLDGDVLPEYIYWVGGGVMHYGAPTSPVLFEPDVP
ncbi:MAG: hypothetical protein HY744_28920 [Deltaproteobacteria bacterium]|nr:hypothetical protein [Deltaproteobacteria bacterium]